MTETSNAPYFVRSLPRYAGSFCVYFAAYLIAASATHYVALDYFQRWVSKYASPLAQWLEDLPIVAIFAVVTGVVYVVGLISVDTFCRGRIQVTIFYPSSFCGAVAAFLPSAVFVTGGSQWLIYACLWLTPLSALAAWTAIQYHWSSPPNHGLRRNRPDPLSDGITQRF